MCALCCEYASTKQDIIVERHHIVFHVETMLRRSLVTSQAVEGDGRVRRSTASKVTKSTGRLGIWRQAESGVGFQARRTGAEVFVVPQEFPQPSIYPGSLTQSRPSLASSCALFMAENNNCQGVVWEWKMEGRVRSFIIRLFNNLLSIFFSVFFSFFESGPHRRSASRHVTRPQRRETRQY